MELSFVIRVFAEWREGGWSKCRGMEVWKCYNCAWWVKDGIWQTSTS